jgi:hypothetical protein
MLDKTETPRAKRDSENSARRILAEEASARIEDLPGERRITRPERSNHLDLAMGTRALYGDREQQTKPTSFNSDWNGTGWLETPATKFDGPYRTFKFKAPGPYEEENSWYVDENRLSLRGRYKSSIYAYNFPQGSEIETQPGGRVRIKQPDGTVITNEEDKEGGPGQFLIRKAYESGKVETQSTTGARVTKENGVTTTVERDSARNSSRTTVELSDHSKTITETSSDYDGVTTKVTKRGPRGELLVNTMVTERVTPNGTKIAISNGIERSETPYLDSDGKPIGTLITETRKSGGAIRIYDVDANGKRIDDPNSSGVLAEKKLKLLEKMRADFRGITFSDDNDGPETIFNGRSYAHRSPSYRELIEIDNALRRAYPANLKADGASIGFAFLNTGKEEIKNEFGTNLHAGFDFDRKTKEPKIYVYSDATRKLAEENGSEGNYFGLAHFRRTMIHEMVHNEDKQREAPNSRGFSRLCSEVAETYGFSQTTEGKWAVRTGQGRYLKTKDGWKNIDRPKMPALQLDSELHAIATVKLPTTYGYTGPVEANADTMALYRLNASSNAQLRKEYPNLHALVARRDRELLDKWGYNAYVRDANGFLVLATKK